MKKLFVLLLLSLPTWAQQYAVVQTNSFTATGGFASITEQNTGILSHKLIWTITGTVTTCQVKLEQSSTGAFGGEETDLIANQTCTSNGSSATTSGNANFIRMKVTTLTGGGSVNVTYQGWNSTPTSTISGTVGVSNLPTTVDTNSGVKSASTLRIVLATDQPQLTNKLLVTPDSVALPANQSVNAAQVGGTNTDTNSGVKSAGTLRVVLATDQPQLTNKLLVTPDSVALPANQSVNTAQVGGTNTDTNSGVKSNGTIRVVLATDQPQLTNKLLVTPDSVALPANQSVNVAQMNGVTTTMGSGVTGTGVQRVVLATDVAIPIGGATISQTVGNGAMAAVDTAGTARPLAYAPFPFDGANSVQARTASLANEAPSSGAFTIVAGLQMVEKGPRWSVTNTGASSGSQGTVSIAAAASKRHVVDCIGFSADSAAAVVAANATLNVRDGATGAGTVIWWHALSFPTASALGIQEIPPNQFCGLNLIGTTNTAMTIEFSAGVTGSIQAVNMSGYDIN